MLINQEIEKLFMRIRSDFESDINLIYTEIEKKLQGDEI